MEIVTGASKRIIRVVNGDFDLTQEAAAVLCDVTVQTMNNWHKQDNAPPRNDDGSYPARAFGQWMVTRQKKKTGPKTPGKEGGIADAELRLKMAQAEKVERENMVAEGTLLSIEEVQTSWTSILARVRTKFLKLPSVISNIVVGITDPYEVHELIMDSVREVLTELSENWQGGDDDDDGTTD
jgi:phage terminase Nu1 subunit (DNA packaging protein)